MYSFTEYFILLLILHTPLSALEDEGTCMKEDERCEISSKSDSRYLFYDVNEPEGFNLRRDVYMRLAIFAHRLLEDNWKLVLPPWPHLYHWRTKSFNQAQLSWSNFFDISSLRKFAPVIEMNEFFKENDVTPLILDSVFVLQHYKDAFKVKNWKWDDKWSFEPCNTPLYYVHTEETYKGWFWGYRNISARSVKCVSFQGGTSLLKQLLEQSKARYVMLDHAEVVLHDSFGDKLYWQCRKSMKFAKPLIEEAKYYLQTVFNVSSLIDEAVDTNYDSRNAKGGPYMCVHLRRRDFITGRPNEIPSIESASKQISQKLALLNLTTVFVATDAPKEEKFELKELMPNYTLVYYTPDDLDLIKFKDGGVAIIEQIICSYARYFIGSHESTFSFRIQEEREILGFPESTTFNRLCGTNNDCVQPSKWRIQL
ncbi:hypothetical protein O3M35_000569 [Rhynocoris fuscipes]|uniref:GDP-fucose protein O-fucosyltransferase 2 n=1 Tax=Rhynocoris fuscipes TaxID=488301 RepID=A0AAW1DM73_9HEMI